jgi:hypothetical protein
LVGISRGELDAGYDTDGIGSGWKDAQEEGQMYQNNEKASRQSRNLL